MDVAVLPKQQDQFQAVIKKVKDGRLSLASECRAMVAFIESISDTTVLKECKAQAAAVLEYLAQRKDDMVEDHNAAVKIKARVEHRLGEVLAATVNHKGGRPKNSDIVSEFPNGRIPKEIPARQSSRAQKLARISWEKIEDAIDAKTAANERVSQSRVVNELLKAQKEAENKVQDEKKIKEFLLNFQGHKPPVEVADCLAFLRRQAPKKSDAPKSIDLVFGSPPYEDARLYLEKGENVGIARKTDEWVAWMVEVFQASLECCKGLVAFVLEGRTEKYRWSASPALLMAELHRTGIHLRKPPIYRRVGIPGSGGPDWLRNDYEFIICATNGGQLPWSENTAMGMPPKFAPGGKPSHRNKDGSRVNGKNGYAKHQDRKNVGPHRARMKAGHEYKPPEKVNPGNVIDCIVGGANMGNHLCHENEAPFPESLAEFFVRSFCPPGGLVCDPFAGSGTTLSVALSHGRRACGCDLRESQVDLTLRRLAGVTPAMLV